MKAKDILNKLKLEVENQLPNNDVLDEVKSTKIEKDLTPVYEEINNNDTKVINNRTSIICFMGLALLMLLLLSWLMPIIAKWFNPEKLVVSRLSIDINPSIELMLDAHNDVIMYMAKNRHAEVLLKDENLQGMSAENATERIVSLALKSGYFDMQGKDSVVNAVMMSAYNDDQKKQEEIVGKVKERIKNFYITNQIYGVVLTQYESKQDFVDMIASMNSKIDGNEKSNMINYSVKNLNMMFATAYQKLRHCFRNDFALSDVVDNTQQLCSQYYQTYQNLVNELNTNRELYDNFDKNWASAKKTCQDNIRLWESEIQRLKNEKENEENPEDKSTLADNIIESQGLLLQEQQQLTEKYNNIEAYNTAKQTLQNNMQSCQNRMTSEYQQYCDEIHDSLKAVKSKVNSINSKLRNAKNVLLQNGRDAYNKHINSRGDYNKFYNSYSSWIIVKTEEINDLFKNWETIRNNWQTTYADTLLQL